MCNRCSIQHSQLKSRRLRNEVEFEYHLVIKGKKSGSQAENKELTKDEKPEGLRVATGKKSLFPLTVKNLP